MSLLKPSQEELARNLFQLREEARARLRRTALYREIEELRVERMVLRRSLRAAWLWCVLVALGSGLLAGFAGALWLLLSFPPL